MSTLWAGVLPLCSVHIASAYSELNALASAVVN